MDIENNINNLKEDILINKYIINNSLENNKNIKKSPEVNNLDVITNIKDQILHILEKLNINIDDKSLEMLKYLINNNITIDEENLFKFNKLINLLEELEKTDNNIKKDFIKENNNLKNTPLEYNDLKNNSEIKNNKEKTNIYDYLLNYKNNKNINNIIKEDIIQKALFILKNSIPISKNNIKILDDILLKDHIIDNNLKEISKSIENISNTKLKEEIIKILENNSMYNPKESLHNFTEKNNLNLPLVENREIENFIKNKENIYKNILNKKTYIKDLLNNNKLDKDSFFNILEDNKIKTSDILVISEVLFKNNIKEKRLFLSKLNIIKENYLFNKFYLNFKDNINVNKKLDDLKTSLFNIKKIIPKNNTENKDLLDSITKTYDSLQFLNSVKDVNYIPIPIFLDNNKLNAKLFLFKNKKTNKNKISALISLDTSYLGKIETFVQKNNNNNNINLQFKLENKNVESILKNNINNLCDLLKSHNYFVSSYSFSSIDKPFCILSEEPKINKNNLHFYKIDEKI